MLRSFVTLKQFSRDFGRAQVFEIIRSRHLISRSKLAELVPVSRATVSGIVAELLEAGLIEEVGKGNSTGGRRPIELRYQPLSRFTIGVVLFDRRINAVLTDMEANPVDEVDLPIQSYTPDSMLQVIEQAIDKLLVHKPRERVLGIGVGAPGVVDFETGVIELWDGTKLSSKTTNIKEILERKLGIPTYVANRSRVAVLGEHKVGVARGVSNVVYLFLGQGTVAGVMIDGNLYMGNGSSAGQIGHVSVVPDGPLCRCGNRGCLQVYASEPAIVANARALAREDTASLLQQAGNLDWLTIDHVIQAASQGDSTALAVLHEAGTKVGFAIATLINLFDPEMIILGGPLGSQAGELLLGPAIQEAKRRAISRSYNSTKIVTGVLGADAAAIGAAVLAICNTPIDVIIGN